MKPDLGSIHTRSTRHAVPRQKNLAGNGAEWRPQKGDAALVVALAGGAIPRDAATAASVSERTVWRRLADPSFRRCVLEARAELVNRSLGRLSDAAVKASDALVALLDCTDERARHAAAKTILDYALPMQDRFTQQAATLRPTRELSLEEAILAAPLEARVPSGPAAVLPLLFDTDED